MSVNRYRAHLVVLPEDSANRQMVNGFLLRAPDAPISVLPEAGGWKAVIERFCNNHCHYLRRFPEARFLLLVDFDRDANRRDRIQAEVPDDLRDRVFLLGVFDEPEALRTDTRLSLERIGEDLARDCQGGQSSLWDHPLLQHNAAERSRLEAAGKGWLLTGNQ